MNNLFAPMKQSIKQGLVKSHEFMLRSGMVENIGPGLFVWLPLGVRVLKKVEAIVHKWHKKLGFQECLAPNLQPAELWHESGRYDAYGKECMRFKDRHDKELVLGPTAEEVFAYIVRTGITSTKQLPTFLYNIQWKYRDEIRPRFGLIRCREFLMCDGYSFNLSPVELEQFYTTALDGYVQMFKELGFANPMPIQQHDTGAVGGSMSHEFFVEADVGEDEIKIENDGESYMARVIELGHIYNLGTKYSDPMNLRFDDKLVWMGCYGVGVSRVVQALIEVLGSEKKMLWPESVAPFKVHFVGCDDPESINLGNMLKAKLDDEVYLDFSGKNFGEKMAIADLIGSPHRIIYMQREIKEGIVVHNGVKTAINDIKHLFNVHT